MPIVAPMVTISTSVWNKFDSQNEVFIICLFAKLQKRQKIPHVSFYFLPVYDFEQCSIRRNIQFTTLNVPLEISKNLSKNAFSFAMTVCFFLPRLFYLIFENRGMGCNICVISVPPSTSPYHGMMNFPINSFCCASLNLNQWFTFTHIIRKIFV